MYEAPEGQDLVDSVLEMIERDTNKEIFTMRILDHNESGLEALIVFKDEAILSGHIKVMRVQGNLALRMKGNFI